MILRAVHPRRNLPHSHPIGTNATTGAFASRGVFTFHADSTTSAIDSEQGGPTFFFSSQLGSWKPDGAGGLVARTIDFDFPPNADVAGGTSFCTCFCRSLMARSEKSDTPVMRTKFAMLFFLVLAVPAFAGGLQQIRSPNRSKVLLVDSSGRRDIISIKSGSKIIRLFYGNQGAR
jgi:hypothetical protein